MVDFQSPENDDLKNIQSSISQFIHSINNQLDRRGGWHEKLKLNKKDKSIEYGTKKGEAIKFDGLPYRPNDRSEILDIRLQFSMSIRVKKNDSNQRYCLWSSSTKTVYLQNSGGDKNDRKRFQGVKFDYELRPNDVGDTSGEGGVNHPVFHAQYDPTCIDSDAFDCTVSNDYEHRPTYPRIPCAPMDFVSVVFMLLNDHRPDIIRDAGGWPDSISDDHLPVFPSEAFTHLLPSDDETTTPESWYHVPVESETAPGLHPDNHRPS